MNIINILKNNKKPYLFLIIENIKDPQNLGNCIRSAAAANIKNIIITKHHTCKMTQTVYKISAGATKYTNIFISKNLTNTINILKQNNIWIIGTQHNSNKNIYNENLTQSIALIIGSEENGIRKSTLNKCNSIIKIPTSNHMKTLNISSAAAICIFEIVRQRYYKLKN